MTSVSTRTLLARAKRAETRIPHTPFDTVTFEELSPRRTRVKVTVQVVIASPEQLESLAEAFRGGLAQSFEKMQRVLQ